MYIRVNLPSRNLNPSPYPPTPNKYLYLWSDYCRGQIFHATWLYFIGNLCHVNTIIYFGKIYSKPQKSPYLHKKTSKPIVQAHSTSFHFLAHDPSSWVSSREFWESWFGGPKSMFSKDPMFKVDKGKYVAWHVFPNFLNSDRSVCNR